MTEKPMIDQSLEEMAEGFEAWLETLSPQEIEDLNALLDSVEEEEIVEPKVVEPKAGKVKCRCCGFAKKPRRMLPSGLCKVCDLEFRDESGEVITDGDEITVVGRQGKRGRNTVSIKHPITGRRWTVKRVTRLDSESATC
jgi:hypothetical protein